MRESSSEGTRSSHGGHISYAVRMSFSKPIMSFSGASSSKRSRYHLIAFSLKGELLSKMCSHRLSVRSFAEAVPAGTGSRA
jgi:hypothetical protein